jgi:hypothetical protein
MEDTITMMGNQCKREREPRQLQLVTDINISPFAETLQLGVPLGYSLQFDHFLLRTLRFLMLLPDDFFTAMFGHHQQVSCWDRSALVKKEEAVPSPSEA